MDVEISEPEPHDPDFRLLFESDPGLSLVFSPDLKIIAVTDAYLKATMTQRDEVLGKSLLEVFPSAPEDPAANGVREMQKSLLKVLHEKRPDQMSLLSYEGKQWTRTNTPLLDAQGELISIVHRVEDVTDQRQLDQVRSDMLLAKDDALRASRVKSQFLANMSHEIRTPLGIILGFSELLLDPSLPSQEREKFVTRVRHSGQHLSGLLSEILDLTKIEAGDLEIENAEVSVDGLLEEVRVAVEPLAQKKKIRLEFSRELLVPAHFRGDRTKLRQILIKLISNAVKFSHQGPICIEAKTDCDPHPNEIHFFVRDHGTGIKPDYLGQLFEEFTQADSSMTRTHGGSGLGLALSRRLARALGGDLELVSTSQAGTTFCARFSLLNRPVKSATESDHFPLPTPARMPSSLKDARILLVDDSPDNLYLIRLLLERAGAKVKTAANGQDAIDQAQAGNYDVILMDIQMPQINGYEATSFLRAQGYLKPIIALTAHALKEDQERCFQSGCDAYLSKPVVAPLLLKTIQKTLAGVIPNQIRH